MNTIAPIYLTPRPASSVFTEQLQQEDTSRLQLLKLCKIQLWGSILISRLAVPFGGEQQIQATWIFAFLFFLIIGARAGWAVSGRRLAGLAAFAVVLMFETFYIHHYYSLFSIADLFAIYAPLCLTLPSMTSEELREIWRSFIKLAVFLALCGLLQLLVEFVAHGYFLDPIALLPDAVQLNNYQTHYLASIGSLRIVKPTGIFTLEPSFFSQFMALGLIGEVYYFRRAKIILLLIVALAASFAGTGVVVLLCGLLFMRRSAKWIFGIVLAGMIWFLALRDTAQDFYARRLTEFETPGESGNARFVLPYQVLWETWQRPGPDAAFGIGAGQSGREDLVYEANYPPVAKAGLEFGILGLITFIIYWAGMYFGTSIPPPILASLFAFYFIASGSFLHAPTVFPVWSLTLGFLSKTRTSRSPERMS